MPHASVSSIQRIHLTPGVEFIKSKLSSVSEPGLVFFSKESKSCAPDDISCSFLKKGMQRERKVCFR